MRGRGERPRGRLLGFAAGAAGCVRAGAASPAGLLSAARGRALGAGGGVCAGPGHEEPLPPP